MTHAPDVSAQDRRQEVGGGQRAPRSPCISAPESSHYSPFHPVPCAKCAVVQATALRDALLEAQPEPMPGSKSGASLLRLPSGARWPQLGDAPLFVRSFYRDCYENVLGSLEKGKRFIIIGNSGSAY